MMWHKLPWERPPPLQPLQSMSTEQPGAACRARCACRDASPVLVGWGWGLTSVISSVAAVAVTTLGGEEDAAGGVQLYKSAEGTQVHPRTNVTTMSLCPCCPCARNLPLYPDTASIYRRLGALGSCPRATDIPRPCRPGAWATSLQPSHNHRSVGGGHWHAARGTAGHEKIRGGFLLSFHMSSLRHMGHVGATWGTWEIHRVYIGYNGAYPVSGTRVYFPLVPHIPSSTWHAPFPPHQASPSPSALPPCRSPPLGRFIQCCP